jgi:hypothetical protein
LPLRIEFDRASQSGDSEDSETASDNFTRVKVATVTALSRISYDFGQSNIMRNCLGSMESYDHFFPRGYGWPPDAESVPDSRANEVIIFEDFFTAGLCMPPHPVLGDILHKFRVQLHHLMPNAVIQISKFI